MENGYCTENTIFKYWNGILPGYIHEIFKPSPCRYSIRSQTALGKTNTEQKRLSGPKICQK